MQEYSIARKLTVDEEIIALFMDYPNLLETTVIKDVYLKDECRYLFKVLKEEYDKNKSVIFERLIQYKNFNSQKYLSLVGMNVYNSSRFTKLKEYEKFLLERYKKIQYEITIKNYDGVPENLYDNLTKINELNYNENESLTAKRIHEELSRKNTFIKLGYNKLDSVLQLSKNDLMIIGGGTGTGKTAFALNLLCNLSKGNCCIYFNMEMSESVIYRRIVSIMSGIDIKKLNNLDSLTKEELEVYKRTLIEIEKREIILVNKAISTKEIQKDISNIHTQKHIVAIIDHIGLIKCNGTSLYEKATKIAKELRSISQNEKTTMIALCQLSRESQKNGDRPLLQNLRDSGEIEQSARKVLLLYNKTPKEQRTNQINDMEVIIAKNDSGMEFIKDFNFDRYTQTFTERK